VHNLTNANGKLFFAASTDSNGAELWKSDGTTSGTQLIKDIYPGPRNSNPSELTNSNGTLFFSARDASSGYELWKSDGTPAGTAMLRDILPGSTGSLPHQMTQVRADGRVLFAASDGVSGMELWESNGTPQGTVRLQDLAPGYASANPAAFTLAGSTIFFAADSDSGRELWMLDQSALGTPIANSARIAVKVDTPYFGRLDAVDLDGRALTYTITDNGNQGVAAITNATSGTFTYTPNPGASGRDTFTFGVTNGQYESEIATVQVIIVTPRGYLPASYK
jgi:ELWxxDGT repeat protein